MISVIILQRVWRLTLSFGLLYLFLVHFCSLGWAEQRQNVPTAVSTDKYHVVFAGEIPLEDPPGLCNYLFRILDKETHEASHFFLDHRYKPIEEMRLSMRLLLNKTLVIETEWRKRPDASTGIHIVDVNKNQLVDEWWCYNPVLSPSNRFWVYEKFYPRHGLPAERASVVLIYDMEKTPAENRIPVIGYTKWPKEQVGLPIYPQAYVNARAYVLPEQQLQNIHWYTLSSPFLWGKDPNNIVFLSDHQNETNIVRVDLTLGIQRPKIFTSPIVVSDFMKPSLSEYVRKREAALLRTLSVADIAWDGPDHVIVKPHKLRQNILLDRIRLAVP
jgi:hypothetical protein